jgi:regulatory protein
MNTRKRSVPKKLDATGLWDYAIRALSSRALSSAEVRAKMLRRADNAADIDPILERLKESKYLDDNRFAENFATARLENHGLGQQRALRDLRGRKVPSATAEKAVTEAYAESDEITLISDFLERKYRNKKLHEVLAAPAGMASAYRKLRYAGFSSGNAILVLKRYSENASDLEGEEDAIANETDASS